MKSIERFIRFTAPKRCGVDQVFGEIATWVLYEELRGNVLFAQKENQTPRERAKLCLPYKPENEKEYEQCLNVLEMVLLQHYESHHNELNGERMIELEKVSAYTAEEAEVINTAADFWN